MRNLKSLRIARVAFRYVSQAVGNFSFTIDRRHTRNLPTLYIDVTNYSEEAISGIPRVIGEFIKWAPRFSADTTVIFVRSKPLRPGFFADPVLHPSLNSRAPITPIKGDSFLGLSLNFYGVMTNTLNFSVWKSRGVNLSFLVYDLTPLKNPQFWSKASDLVPSFELWFKLVALSTRQIITNTHAVKLDIQNELVKLNQPKRIIVCALGAELWPCSSGQEFQNELLRRLTKDGDFIGKSTVFLSVGTIEPRKGLLEVLRAFESLPDNLNWKWLIVGNLGWEYEEFLSVLKISIHFEKKIFLISGTSDTDLGLLYHRASVLIAASFDEGFGLPVKEAMIHGMSLIARDLPVFREVSGNQATFFSGSGLSLTNALSVILTKQSNLKQSALIKNQGWREAVQSVCQIAISERGQN